MATYHNPSSDLRKKVAKKIMKPCSTLLRGFYYVKGYLMDLIYQAAAKYVALQQYEYEFVLSHRRKIRKIKLSFSDKEFFHLAGLQHLTDIQIPRNKNKTLDYILFSRAITDETIGKSKFFREKIPEGNIKSRIEELRFLEEYLDTDNIIKIFSIKNQRYLSSLIDADYIIESQISPGITVYIFLKCINDATGECRLISFFKKENIAYGGDILYWMMKTKHNIFIDKNIILYKCKCQYKNVGFISNKDV